MEKVREEKGRKTSKTERERDKRTQRRGNIFQKKRDIKEEKGRYLRKRDGDREMKREMETERRGGREREEDN